MRHSPRACRRAAQSLQPAASQHIWISDDVLTTTYNYFFRTSCPQQRRHGSHTPGPLEARRRAAKRQLSLTANSVPQGGFPQLFSFGALFGFRSTPTMPSWRYEPPSRPKASEPLDVSLGNSVLPSCFSEPSLENNQASFQSASSDTLYLADPAPSLEHMPYIIDLPAQALAAPELQSYLNATQDWEDQTRSASYPLQNVQTSFDRFAKTIAGADELSKKDQSKFLESAIQDCSPNNELDGAFTLMVLEHLIATRWSPALIIGRLSARHVSLPSIYTPEGLQFLYHLDTLSQASVHRIPRMGRLYTKIAESAQNLPDSSAPHEDASLFLLIRGLWHSACSQGTQVDASVAQLLSHLGSKVSNTRVRRRLLLHLYEPANAMQWIVPLIIDATQKPELFAVAEQVLNCLPQALLRSWIPFTTLGLLKSNGSGKSSLSTSHENLRYLDVWFRMLHALDSKGNSIFSATCLTDVAFGHVTKYFFSDYYSRLPPQIFIKVLQYRLLRHSSLEGFSTVLIDSVFTSSFEHLAKHEHPIRPNESVATLMAQLEAASLPYYGIADLLLPVIYEHKGLRSCLDLLERLVKRRLTLYNTTFLENIVSEKLDGVSELGNTLANKEYQRNASTLHLCRRIKKALVQLRSQPLVHLKSKIIQSTASQRFLHILGRASGAHMLPMAYRNLTADIPMHKRSELVHHLADQYSLDMTRSHLQNWRSIYYLYKYLRIYNLPINPLFTKAMVRVSLARPLSENRFVCSRRIKWVCQIVAQVEGEAVAKKLEYDIWVWRGNLIAHAKRALIDSGGTGHAHVNTMKRLGLI